MTLKDAFLVEVPAAQMRFRYLKDAPDDRWKQEDEFIRDGGGDCEDWANVLSVWACRRVGNTPDEECGMVIGDVPGRHAWIGLGRDRLWIEPTPGYPILCGEPWRFNRTPLWYRQFVAGVGFTEKREYQALTRG